MVMIVGFFDTVILIDALKNIKPALDLLEKHQRLMISRITWMEVMCGATTQHQLELFQDFLTNFEIVELNELIAHDAVALRKEKKLKIPDAIILATAQSVSQKLYTRNTKDFSKNDINIIIPYSV